MLIAFPVVPLPDDTPRVTVAVSEPCVPVPVIVSVKAPRRSVAGRHHRRVSYYSLRSLTRD